MANEQNDLFVAEPQDEKTTREIAPLSRSQELDLVNRPHWFVESNFMSLPIFTFDKKQSDKAGRVVHSVPIVKDGVLVTSKITISAVPIEVGGGKFEKDSLPGAFDMQVMFCLMDMWDEQGRPVDGKVHFRLNTVATRLRMNDSGRSFEQIKNSIKKLRFTAIESINAFYNAEKSKHVSIPISIIQDYAISTNRGNTKAQDACMVQIGQHILSNLIEDYTTKVNRKIYQQLNNGFAQRILSLVLYKQQMDQETGAIDFELNSLAALIPISGKLYVSTIKNRLKTALEELDDKKVFKHEFITHGGATLLRLKPFEQQENFLVGKQSIARFEVMVLKIYKKSIYEILDMTREALERKIDKEKKVFEYANRKYSWVFFCIDVALFQIMKLNFKITHTPSVLLNSFITKGEDALDIPDAFEPSDVLYKKILLKEQAERVVTVEAESRSVPEEVIRRTAANYAERLTTSARKHYEELVQKEFPLTKNNTGMLKTLIIASIHEDIKAGKDIDLIKDDDVQTALAIGSKSTN